MYYTEDGKVTFYKSKDEDPIKELPRHIEEQIQLNRRRVENKEQNAIKEQRILSFLATKMKTKVGEKLLDKDADMIQDNSKFIFDQKGNPIDITKEDAGKQTR